VLCRLFPLDRARNADRMRRRLPVPGPLAARVEDPHAEPGIAPLLRKLMRDYAATGLPPAYLPGRAEVVAVDDSSTEAAPEEQQP
jgi:hypothetical protein